VLQIQLQIQDLLDAYLPGADAHRWSEEKLLNRMKNYAAKVFTPLLDPRINAKKYWYSMEVPYFARYAYTEKLGIVRRANLDNRLDAARHRAAERISHGQ